MQDPNSSAFHQLEKSGWESAVKEYDEGFGRLTVQSITPMLDALQLHAGQTLLDVACGPGYLAAAAAQRGAAVTGLDFSGPMVVLAQQRHPQVQFREGDAQALPFSDASFDAVAMNYGLLHLDQPQHALAEAARVLKPGGRCGFTVWAAPPQTAAFRIVLGAVERHGRSDVALPPGPPFFRYSDAETAKRALIDAGLLEPKVVIVPQVWRFARAEDLFEAMLRGTVRTAALLRAQTSQALEAIRATITAEATQFSNNDTIELPMPSVLMTAGKAGPGCQDHRA
jgi:ubiquinone/menaquinone biosynthesis C-methylase UbiE